jgi:hypothetical protein
VQLDAATKKRLAASVGAVLSELAAAGEGTPDRATDARDGLAMAEMRVWSFRSAREMLISLQMSMLRCWLPSRLPSTTSENYVFAT